MQTDRHTYIDRYTRPKLHTGSPVVKLSDILRYGTVFDCFDMRLLYVCELSRPGNKQSWRIA